MRHNIPDIYTVLTRKSFSGAIHGLEVGVKNCILGDEGRTIIPDAHVVWKSDCLALNFDNSYMKVCTNGSIIYVGEVSDENKAAWEEFIDNYEFSD